MQKVLRRFIMDDLKRLIDASPVYEDLRKSYEELRSIREMLTNHEDIQICNGQLATYKEALLCIKNAPTVDAVEVADKELRKAINLLIKQYEHSKNSDYVHSPVAHAFYYTWKQLDDGRRE
jgi:hypothetical protein